MGSYPTHSMVFDDGGAIVLPPNPSYVNLQKPSLHVAATPKLYDLSTKYIFGDKVFKYCRGNTGGTLSPQHAGKNQNAIGIAYTTLSYPDAGAATVAAAVGATSVYVVKASVAADDYKYGHVILGHNAAATVQNRGIISNDASATIAAVANVVKLNLDYALHTALVAATSGIEAMKCIYSAVSAGDGAGGSSEYMGAVCVPCIYIATQALEYFWGQTWGPVWLTPGADGYGAESGERVVCFDGYGSVQDLETLLDLNKPLQIAGFLLDNTSAPEDCSFVMLQISQ